MHYDIVIATDCRLPGGTTGSVAEEVMAQWRAGYRTGLLHVPSSLSVHARSFAPKLQQHVVADRCDVVTGREVSADLLVIRHPKVAQELDLTEVPTVRAAAVVLVANQAPGEATGDAMHYDPMRADHRVSEWVGPPRWAPIGPLVRENLQRIAPGLELDTRDWVNVIDVDAWRVPRRTGVRRPLRIGRHSRDHPLKWPGTRAELLDAYPDADDIEVRILGGARTPRELLGGELPRNWTVVPFGGMPVDRFLASVDFFVYHHHPRWVEAFGRTIIEALASGTVALLPPHFEPLFGSAALYRPPRDTVETIRALADDPTAFRERSERGTAAVAERFSHATHLERLTRAGVPVPEAPVPSVATTGTATPDASAAPPPDAEGPTRGDPRRRRVLMVSSNGAGVGHLMRLMAIARRFPDPIEPVFLTLSQAASVVSDLGFHVEYLPSRTALDAPHRSWHALLRSRVLQLIDGFDLDAVVFDGTWPYDGLMDALAERPEVRSVWSRRAMWRPEVTRHLLHLGPRFDLVVEPGELARDADRGATVARRPEAVQVGPITFLRDAERLGRADARRELGLPEAATIALVQLGAGNINDTSSVSGMVIDALRTQDPDLHIVVTRSAISKVAEPPAGVQGISAYPLARYLGAFDIAVAASGYNTFHELMDAGVPTVFVPNVDTATDDQLARARWAQDRGLARCALESDRRGLLAAIATLVSPGFRRDAAAAHHERAGAGDGGQQAADRIASLLDGPSDPARRVAVPASLPAARRPSLRSRARHAVDALPAPLRRLLERLWHRLRPARPASRGGPIPVPVGHAWDPSISPERIGILLVLPEALSEEQIADVVHRTAVAQQAFGGFAPMFVTASTTLSAFRAAGYGVEVLPSERTLAALVGDERAAASRSERLRELLGHYDIDHVITCGDPRGVPGLLAAVSRRSTPSATPSIA